MEVFMRRGFLSILVILCLCTPAEAALFTQAFYVKIDSVTIKETLGNDWYYGPEVGSVFKGSVTYDDTNVPDSGAFMVGHTGTWPEDTGVDELQDWFLAWEGVTPLGWELDFFYDVSRLFFLDGRLTGIHSIWHADQQGGIEDEGFLGRDYISYGYHPILEAPGGYDYVAKGSLSIPVPEPAVLFTLAAGLLWLGVCTRRITQLQ